MAAAAIVAAAGPCQSSPVSAESTEWYDKVVERNSAANPCHAAAAASMGPEPDPEYMRPELISGGSIAKSSIAVMVGPLPGAKRK